MKTNHFIINENLDIFENNKIYLTSFFKALWECPELVYEIIKYSEPIIIKDNLSSFIINFFYIDYTSGNYIENNLLYVIALLLKDEFEMMEKIENIDLYFENSNLKYILGALGEIPDVQNFFKNLIIKSLDKIERSNIVEAEFNIVTDEKSIKSSSSRRIKRLSKKNINREDINNTQDNQRKINIKKLNENSQIFAVKYSKDLKLEEIKSRKEKAKNENKNDIYLFFAKIEEELNNSHNENLFGNKKLMKNFMVSDSPTDTLSIYQNELIKNVNFIEQLISDFENSIFLMPKFIKSICKIISELIKNKCKNFTRLDENKLISKFLINKLLLYYLSSPNYNALINQFVISKSTYENLQEIKIVLEKLFSGKLFKNNNEEGNYTPYNWLIIQKFENVLNLIQNSKNVKLPIFINKLIENKLPNDYVYDYFEENKNKIFKNISICFTLDNILSLIDSIIKIKNFGDGNEKKNKIKKSFDKIVYKNNMSNINKINEQRIENYFKEIKDKNNQIDKNRIKNYFILNVQIFDKKYEKLFSLNNDKMKYFYIDIKANDKNQLSEKEINLINLKNNISGILSSYRPLDISDYSFNDSATFTEIFSEIQKYIELPNYSILKSNNLNISNWYISSIFDYINKIPNEYKVDDYQKVLNELSTSVKDSINEINLDQLTLIKNKNIFLNKSLDYYNEKSFDIKEILLNENIKIITEGISLLIDFKFAYNDNEKYFYLNKSTYKHNDFEGSIIFNSKRNCFILNTIEAFTIFFPNLAEYNFSMDISPLEIIKELSINTKLKEYFELIKINIIKNLSSEKDKYNSLYKEKIVNYFMDKIYEKIYPPIPDIQDTKIMNIMRNMPKSEVDKMVKKDYNLENLIPNMVDLFKKVYYARTPLYKLQCLKDILSYVNKIISLKKGTKNDAIGADDIFPVLNYFLINAKPYKIITDINFIKTFKCILPPCDNDLIIFDSITKTLLNYTNNKK